MQFVIPSIGCLSGMPASLEKNRITGFVKVYLMLVITKRNGIPGGGIAYKIGNTNVGTNVIIFSGCDLSFQFPTISV
jgi:hypothetical protein